MANLPVFLVDIIGEVVASMVAFAPDSSLIKQAHYEAGRLLQVNASLQKLDGSLTLKGTKFPLIILHWPWDEDRGRINGDYATVRIPRISISVLNESSGTDSVAKRYDKAFRTQLYPLYYEFIKRLAQHPQVKGVTKDTLPHTKRDNPGSQPIPVTTDYVDTIDLLNLEFKIIQIKNC